MQQERGEGFEDFQSFEAEFDSEEGIFNRSSRFLFQQQILVTLSW